MGDEKVKGEGASVTERDGKPTLTQPQCINELQRLAAQLSQITELSSPTVQDDELFDELTREYDKIDAHRRDLERQAINARVQGNTNGLSAARFIRAERGTPGGGGGSSDAYDTDGILEPDSIEQRRFRNPWDLENVRMFGRSQEEINSELRSRALSAIEQMPSANDRLREAATTIVERFDDKDAKLSRFALLASSPDYMRAFAKAATNRVHEVTASEQRALDGVRALSLTDSAGGFLVPFQLDPTVVVTANGSLNDIRKVARNVVATGDVWNGVTAGAVNWSWDAEATEVSDDSPTFASPGIPVYKASGFVPVSIEALQDMANGAQEVAKLLAEGREILEAAAFAIGSGVGQPTGIVTALAGTSSVVTSADTDILGAGDIYRLHDSLPARYRGRGSWLASNSFYSRTRQFDESGGSALWAQLGADRPAQLIGKPVYEAEDMDSSITASAENYMAVFGDFQNMVICDRIGMTVEFIPHLFSSPASSGSFGRPTGQRGWYAYYRTGSGVLNRSAFRMLNVS